MCIRDSVHTHTHTHTQQNGEQLCLTYRSRSGKDHQYRKCVQCFSGIKDLKYRQTPRLKSVRAVKGRGLIIHCRYCKTLITTLFFGSTHVFLLHLTPKVSLLLRWSILSGSNETEHKVLSNSYLYGIAPVSYTHLDVYKRQFHTWWAETISLLSYLFLNRSIATA